jgi:hypothetical protein
LFPKEEDEKDLMSYDERDQPGRANLDDSERAERGRKIRSALGPLGKLHNIIVHIRSSPQRTREFIAQALRRIPLDNRTRWNSWFQMLDTIFQEQGNSLDLERIIDKYVQKHIEELSSDVLETKEWTQIRTMYEYLLCFSSATLLAEGHSGALYQILENLDVCQILLNEGKVCRTTVLHVLTNIY